MKLNLLKSLLVLCLLGIFNTDTNAQVKRKATVPKKATTTKTAAKPTKQTTAKKNKFTGVRR